MAQLPPEQLDFLIQFIHPEKSLVSMPGVGATEFAALFELSPEEYRDRRSAFTNRARQTAEELFDDTDFAACVDRLPFTPGSTVVGLGDSITDDLQSWLEILRHLLDLRRPQDDIRVVNAGISGDTTSQMISRFLAVVLEEHSTRIRAESAIC